MTVIVAGARDGKVLMAADSGMFAGYERERMGLSKLFRRGPLVLGVSGAPRVSDVLRYAELPELPDGAPHEVLVTQLVPVLRELVEQHGLLMSNEGQSVLLGGSALLIGFRGQVWTLDSEFAVLTYAEPFTAIGVGSPYALAAMSVVRALRPTAPLKGILGAGLHAAATFCTHVQPPFDWLESEP